MTGRNKSIRPDSVPGEILQLGGEAMILYFVRLLDITIKNLTIPSGWKRATEVPIYKGGDRSIDSHKLQTVQLNLSGLQANGTRHNRLP